ncbi:hypothetical protein IE53DRAFT_390025 [Violaceomyces palustris]|uniref:Uncharacterized protein n=1 Tax=Violaceomyces palustris TaxID=1673888 RepID=A0ACD0NPW3_9BASI|nr:hypothetical protein IE53DRAFT_390025 [Violaceomyces palustris]
MKAIKISSLGSLACGLMVPLSMVVSAAPLNERQAPNTVYPGNESQMTASQNVTFWVLPIDKAEAQKMAGYPLIQDTGLPKDVIPEGKHPLVFAAGYMYDIRQLGLRVDRLMAATTYLPFVDRLGNGTPFQKSVRSYLDQIIPPLVATLTQFDDAEVAKFDPSDAAYKAVGDSLAYTVSQGIDNPVDGPGVLFPRFQAAYQRAGGSSITAQQYMDMVNQPYFAYLPTCKQTTWLFNESFADPFFVQGQVQTYSPVTEETTIFDDVQGYSATTEWISPAGLGSDCSTFSK